jgi:hypothetical protein
LPDVRRLAWECSFAGLGLLSTAVSRRRLGVKGLFNAGSAMLAIGTAAHVSALLGGETLLTSGSGWTALPMAILASVAYYVVSATTVAGAVALDRLRPIWALQLSVTGEGVERLLDEARSRRGYMAAA